MSEERSEKPFQPVLYKMRWLMLLLFSSASLLNAYHWIHLNIISDRILYIWNQTIPGYTESFRQLAVDWLSMVYLLAYIPLIVPATWVCDHFGLRITTLVAVILNAAGAWIKCLAGVLAVDPFRPAPMSVMESGAFGFLMFGQLLDAIAQVFILGVPAQLAATWFGEREIGTATSIGVLANQLGVAIGFAIPPLVVPIPSPALPLPNSTADVTFTYVHRHLMYLLYVGAAVNTLPIIATVFFFKNEPPSDPTFAQYARRKSRLISKQHQDTEHLGITALTVDIRDGISLPSTNKHGFQRQLSRILRNRNYVLLLISYGINTGIYYALGTLLNFILLQYFPGSPYIGWMGFLMIVAGIKGSIIAGVLLDRTKKFRLIITIIYLLTLVWMGGFTGVLLLRSVVATFIAIFFLGLTMTGFLPIGFEYAAELTYPANEGLTSGLINASAQAFGIIFTIGANQMSVSLDTKLINSMFTAGLAVGFVLLLFVQEDLRRQKMQNQVALIKQQLINSELNATIL